MRRFWEKVVKTNNDDGCWLWCAAKDDCGYGVFSIDGKNFRAHRLSYELTIGTIPKGLKILHKCDTPACVNPSHLFIGTQADNIKDCMEKGRRGSQKGADNSGSKLTPEQVAAIRMDARLYRYIAADYGIHPATVGRIKSRKRWASLGSVALALILVIWSGSAQARIVSHPQGCPWRLFCGCGASVEIFGRPIRSLYLAANWLKFPRAACAPGHAAARSGHVFVIRHCYGDGTVLAYDANSGGHQTRIHRVSLRGYRVVDPHGSRTKAYSARRHRRGAQVAEAHFRDFAPR